ncbi:MAG: helix-turn-helix transcriptional regulator [Clostridia bacterium]|nr:helix-turn-helix transcriptional regulator [Clostridia bacterium]
MSIAENIAGYRKLCGLTQEQLGERLGVTNQAVSKWESAASHPDILLLPKIAEVLGITLEELYGIEKPYPAEERVTADAFPKAANDHLIDYFVRQSGMRFIFTGSEEENLEYHRKKLYESSDCVLGCISDEAGAVFASGDLSYINTDYKTEGSEEIFVRREIASILKKLADPTVRQMLAYMYRESFTDKETANKAFLVSSAAGDCGLDEETAFDAIEKLREMNLLETYVNGDHVTEYSFLKSRAVFVFTAFKLFEKMTMDFVFNVMRDTSAISDYAFEKLWK